MAAPLSLSLSVSLCVCLSLSLSLSISVSLRLLSVSLQKECGRVAEGFKTAPGISENSCPFITVHHPSRPRLQPACLNQAARTRYSQGIPPQTARKYPLAWSPCCARGPRARSAVRANATGFATRGHTARVTMGGVLHSLACLRRSAGRCAGCAPGGSSRAAQAQMSRPGRRCWCRRATRRSVRR